jgi:hypothetical protein
MVHSDFFAAPLLSESAIIDGDVFGEIEGIVESGALNG